MCVCVYLTIDGKKSLASTGLTIFKQKYCQYVVKLFFQLDNIFFFNFPQSLLFTRGSITLPLHLPLSYDKVKPWSNICPPLLQQQINTASCFQYTPIYLNNVLFCRIMEIHLFRYSLILKLLHSEISFNMFVYTTSTRLVSLVICSKCKPKTRLLFKKNIVQEIRGYVQTNRAYF